MNTYKSHWEKIYQTKNPQEVSWTQELPKTSLELIHGFNLPKNAAIIDIGGGDSKLVDHLLDEGFEDITVLDISEHALKRAQQRLGKRGENVKWIVSDILTFKPERHYTLWHDRATFHFLTTTDQVEQYLEIAEKNIDGFLTIGTFSNEGPDKCSGLPIKQYSENQLVSALKKGFDKIKCILEDHITPFQTKQNFLFCSFRKHNIV